MVIITGHPCGYSPGFNFEFSNESLLPRSKWDEQQHRRRRGRQHAVNGKARLAGLLHQSDIDCAKYVQTSCRLYCLRWCCLAGAWHDTRRRLCRQYSAACLAAWAASAYPRPILPLQNATIFTWQTRSEQQELSWGLFAFFARHVVTTWVDVFHRGGSAG